MRSRVLVLAQSRLFPRVLINSLQLRGQTGWVMTLPLLPLALFSCSAIYFAMFIHALATGKASTRYHRRVDRAANPVGFWAAQAFNAIFAIAGAFGGIIVWTGW
jgi:hypothetical protein